MYFKILELRPYMIDDDMGVYEMLQEIPFEDEFIQRNQYYGLSKFETKKEIEKITKYAYGIDVSEDNPQSENYVLFVDDKPVAIGGLMLKMTDYWKIHRGHIWYKTRPSERRKKYASVLVNLLVEKAKSFGLNEILAQCSNQNIGSIKVLKNNGFKEYENKLATNNTQTIFFKKELNFSNKKNIS